jgi:transcriptional regulator of acetoin/glycerol metabolism
LTGAVELLDSKAKKRPCKTARLVLMGLGARFALNVRARQERRARMQGGSRMSDQGQTESLARRFQQRLVEVARQGIFGKIRTRNAGLQSAYAHLISLLDSPEVPVLVYGGRGAGKRRHVDELFVMHNFHRRLSGQPEGKLKVYRGDFVTEGFSSLLSAPGAQAGDLLYLEGIDLLNAACQRELLEFLRRRKGFADKGLSLPRLVFGTERALSMLVILKEFDRELFTAITGFAVFLPNLQERAEDIPHLVQAFVEEFSGRVQTPPSWLVDFIGKQDWKANLEELASFLRQGLSRNSELAAWTPQDLPAVYQPRAAAPFVRWGESADADKLRSVLLAAKGDRRQGARTMGVPYADFLQMMLACGLR